jgi:hypothetical protein
MMKAMRTIALRWLKFVAITYTISLACITVLWLLLSGGDSCTIGQEIEEGCRVVFPDTYIFLAVINIFITGIICLVPLASSAITQLFRKMK